MLHCTRDRNAQFNMITNKVTALQRSSDMRFKSLHNDEKNIVNIIKTLIQLSMLKKEMSKDHS